MHAFMNSLFSFGSDSAASRVQIERSQSKHTHTHTHEKSRKEKKGILRDYMVERKRSRKNPHLPHSLREYTHTLAGSGEEEEERK